MQVACSTNSLPLAMMISANSMPGHVSMPVPRGQVLYSHFEHVAGVAATEGRMVSVDKLQILNTLIERLISTKENPLAARAAAERVDPDRIDALLEQYGREAHALAVRSGPYASSLSLTPGSLLSLAA